MSECQMDDRRGTLGGKTSGTLRPGTGLVKEGVALVVGVPTSRPHAVESRVQVDRSGDTPVPADILTIPGAIIVNERPIARNKTR